jgi:hypothetical protein
MKRSEIRGPLPLSFPDFAVCPEGRVSPVEEESTQIIVDSLVADEQVGWVTGRFEAS